MAAVVHFSFTWTRCHLLPQRRKLAQETMPLFTDSSAEQAMPLGRHSWTQWMNVACGFTITLWL